MDKEALARQFAEEFRIIDKTVASPHEIGARHNAFAARSRLEEMMLLPEFDSNVIARALTIAIEGHAYQFVAAKAALVNAYLQRKLTEEHVAAQTAMSKAAEDLSVASVKLTRATYWLTIVTVVIAAVGLALAIWQGAVHSKPGM